MSRPQSSTDETDRPDSMMSASQPTTDGTNRPKEKSARQTNSQLLKSLLKSFLKDPKTDLKDLIPADYEDRFRDVQPPVKGKRETRLAMKSRKFIARLLSSFSVDPKGNLLKDHDLLLHPALGPKKVSKTDLVENSESSEESESEHFSHMLDSESATTLEVIGPLSQDVRSLLKEDEDESQDPVSALKKVVRESVLVWELGFGSRFVAKLNDQIAVKVTYDDQSTSHLAYELLAKHAPDVPAPKPHGLVKVGSVSVLFLSYIPKVTLAEVWPKLSDPEKASITAQLEVIMTKIRRIPRNGLPLGLLNGAGVVDERARHDSFEAEKPLHTVAEFEDFLFSYRPWVTTTYVQFLQQLLPASRFDERCVFTHCDIRPDNIMVDTDEGGKWHVSGIVDWEEAGFYPSYWESVKATRTFIANMEDDWWLRLPPSIAPSRYPQNWLVDRHWEQMMEPLRRMDKSAREYREKHPLPETTST